jgi:hypothetical protein
MPAWLHELLYTLSGAALLSCGLSAWLAVSEANERGGDPTLAGTAGIAAVGLLITLTGLRPRRTRQPSIVVARSTVEEAQPDRVPVRD